MNDLLIGLLQAEFDAIGLSLVDFNIRIALHPNSLEVVTKMGYGTSYTQMQQADAVRAAAENPGGAEGLAGIGMGMMGMSAAQQQQLMMQQQMAAQQAQQAAGPAAAWHAQRGRASGRGRQRDAGCHDSGTGGRSAAGVGG